MDEYEHMEDRLRAPMAVQKERCREYREMKRRNRAAREESQDWERDYRLRTAFGITLAEYDAMLEEQGGVCAICGKPPKSRRLAVDHDHDTGVVRGLLCPKCNMRLGVVERYKWMAKAVDYLESYA